MKRVRRTLKKYFVPHEENEHKPHLLRARSVVFVLIVAIIIESSFLFGSSYLAPRSRLFGIIVTNALVDETNAGRAQNNLPALRENSLLDVAARAKANDMATNNYFAHTSPAGLSPWYWFEQAGYQFEYAGENLAVNFSDSQDITNAWMNSVEHRANILNASFTDIGMATATGTYEGHLAVYVVELFGTPVPPAPPAEPIAFVNSASAAGNTSPAAAPVTTGKPTTTSHFAKNKPIANIPPAATSGNFVTATSSIATGTTVVLGPAAVAGMTAPIAPQSNPIQHAAANPRQVVDYLYLAIIALFAVALGINIFVKIRIQYPQLIFGGMLVILVAGLLIILNQHLLAGAVIL